MSKTITTTLPDGTEVTYENVPADVTPEQVRERAYKDYMGETGGGLKGALRAAHSGATAGARSLSAAGQAMGGMLPPAQQMMLEAMRKLTPESQASGPVNLAPLGSDYEPQTTAEKYIRSGTASAVAGLPLGGWTPTQLSANVLSGLLGEAGSQANLAPWQIQILSMLPQASLTGAHLLQPRLAAKDLQTAVAKVGPEAVTTGRQTAEAAGRRGVQLLPGQSIAPPPGVQKSPVETLMQEVSARPQGAPIHQALRAQDKQLEQLAQSTRQQTSPLYAQGARQFPAATDPARQATEIELGLLGAGRGVGRGTAGETAVTNARSLGLKNVSPAPGASTGPSSYTAISDAAADAYAKAQQALANGDGTAFKFWTETSVKLKRLAETNPDVQKANSIVAEVKKLEEAAARGRGGLSRANPIGAGEVASSPVATAASAGVSAATAGPAASGFPVVRSIKEGMRNRADKKLALAFADPSWQKFDRLLNDTKVPTLMLDALRLYQAGQLHGEQ